MTVDCTMMYNQVQSVMHNDYVECRVHVCDSLDTTATGVRSV